MLCREVVFELDAFLTGELDVDANAEVERHLQECAGCRTELALVRKENAVYREYVSRMAVSGARRRFAAESGRPKSAVRWWRWAAAAAVLAVAVLSWRFYEAQQHAGIAGNVPGGRMTEMPGSVLQAVRSYEQAVSLLQASYEMKKPNLDPRLVGELDRNLHVAGAAVLECKLALEKHPDSPQVIEFLLLDYEKQVGILKQIMEAL